MKTALIWLLVASSFFTAGYLARGFYPPDLPALTSSQLVNKAQPTHSLQSTPNPKIATATKQTEHSDDRHKTASNSEPLQPVYSRQVSMTPEEMLNILHDLVQQTGHGRQLAAQLDAVKSVIRDQPQLLQGLIHTLAPYPTDSRGFNVLLGAIKSLPEQQSNQVLLELATEHLYNFHQDSQQKMVALLSHTTHKLYSPEIIQHLVDIGSASESSVNMQLEVMGLLEPSQLGLTQTERLTQNLQQQLHDPEQQPDIILAQLMRFLPPERKIALTEQGLSPLGEHKLRLAVMEYLETDGANLVGQLSSSLTNLASAPEEPLAIRAQALLAQPSTAAIYHE